MVIPKTVTNVTIDKNNGIKWDGFMPILLIFENMKIIYSILFLSLFACSRKGNNFSAASFNLTDDIVSQIENTSQNGLTDIYKDSTQMERYQTFDECTMAGERAGYIFSFCICQKTK